MAKKKSNPNEPNRSKPDHEVKLQNGIAVTQPFTPGEVQTLLDLRAEFGPKQLTVTIIDTPAARIVDVKADTVERAKYIEFLLGRVREGQAQLKRAFQL